MLMRTGFLLVATGCLGIAFAVLWTPWLPSIETIAVMAAIGACGTFVLMSREM